MPDRESPIVSRTPRFHVADVTLDLRTGRVQRGGDRLALEPRTYDLLVHFVQHAGEVLSRDALLDAIWKDVHVGPHSLTQAVLQLRQALGDDTRHPQFIETVHRRGYRFVAPVRPLESVHEVVDRVSALPARTSSLLGRDVLLQELTTRLEQTRLLTLAGPGGVGKTQLALELARRVEDRFRSCVLVDLAILDDASMVERDIGLALGAVDGTSGDFLQRVAATVRARRVLLVLDNCEPVVEGCRSVVQGLLETCPSLRVLATTQVPLAARAETVVRIPPLPVPDAISSGASRNIVELGTNPAVALFAQSARSVEASFALTPDNAAAICEICRRLEGVPLAIELAASRVGVLTPQQIAQRLDDPLHFLARRHATKPPRHETLAATLEWSVALLTDSEKTLLTRLGAFNGGWTLEAAGAVGEDVSGSGGSVLEGLHSLVEKSLIIANTHGPRARYRLLETVRLYAQARLNAAPDAAGVRARHLGHYEELVVDAGPQLLSAGQGAAVAAIEQEIGNIRDALDWGLSQQSHLDAAVRLATAMQRYWYFRGLLCEGREWLERAVDKAQGCAAETRARAECALGIFRHQFADFFAARQLLTAGLSRLDGTDLAQRSLTLGFLAFNLAMTGDADGAERASSEAMALAEQLADEYLAGVSLIGSAVAEVARGKAAEAAAVLEEACTRLDRSGERFMITYATVNLGLQRYLAGQVADAERAFLRGLRASAEIRNHRSIGGCLEGLGYIATTEGDDRWAARLLGAAAAAREVTALPLFPHWTLAHARTVETLETRLGRELYEREWTAGGQTDLGDLVTDILFHQN